MVCSEVVINVSLCDNSECELGLNPAFVTRNLQMSSVVMSGFVVVVEQVLQSLRVFRPYLRDGSWCTDGNFLLHSMHSSQYISFSARVVLIGL